MCIYTYIYEYIYIHIYTLSHIIFHQGPPQEIGYSSLCCTVRPPPFCFCSNILFIYLFIYLFFVFLSFVVVVVVVVIVAISWAAPTAYGGSQTRGLIGAVAASLRHSNTGSELHLRLTRQLTATPDL